MRESCETSTIVASAPIEAKRKGLNYISPIPQRNVAHCHVNMTSQGETSNPQTY